MAEAREADAHCRVGVPQFALQADQADMGERLPRAHDHRITGAGVAHANGRVAGGQLGHRDLAIGKRWGEPVDALGQRRIEAVQFIEHSHHKISAIDACVTKGLARSVGRAQPGAKDGIKLSEPHQAFEPIRGL